MHVELIEDYFEESAVPKWHLITFINGAKKYYEGSDSEVFEQIKKDLISNNIIKKQKGDDKRYKEIPAEEVKAFISNDEIIGDELPQDVFDSNIQYTKKSKNLRDYAHAKLKIDKTSFIHHIDGDETNNKFSNVVELPREKLGKDKQNFAHFALELLSDSIQKNKNNVQPFSTDVFFFDENGNHISKTLIVSLE